MMIPVAVFVFLLGLAVGSFLNVCIHRLPLDKSIVTPGSHCPQCGKGVLWYDNIPLVSYLILRAKCRHCGTKISPRYFFVELATGLLWLSLWVLFGLTPWFVAGVILFSLLLALSVTDLETGLIPDRMTFPGMAMGLALSGFFPYLQGREVWYQGLLHSGLGLLAGGGSLLLIGLIGNLIYRRDSMGGGDIKLLAMIGSFLGAKKVILVLLFAPIAAMPIAFYLKFFRKAETLPFGPYLAIAGAGIFLYGDWVSGYFFKF